MRLVWIFVLGLALRLGFVAWAPREPTGDGRFYDLFAHVLARSGRYINLDGSPVVTWMPGWPALIAAVYKVAGMSPTAVMVVSAVLGAATAVLVAVLARRLFDDRGAALAAGLLYAAWPGLIYYSATFYTENLFNFLLAIALIGLVAAAAARPGARRVLACAGAGVLIGACAMVKSEPLVLVPVALGYLALKIGPSRELAGAAAALVLGLALTLTPWTIRNYTSLGYPLPTPPTAGEAAYVANHPGAFGSNNVLAAKRLHDENRRPTQAETMIASNKAGWRHVIEFARTSPGEFLTIVARKIRITYRSDSYGASLVRGYMGRERWHLDPAEWRFLRAVADAWWYPAFGLAIAGAGLALRRHRDGALLLLGLVAVWLCLHLVFQGGDRYHVPETIAYAPFAGLATAALARWSLAVKRPPRPSTSRA